MPDRECALCGWPVYWGLWNGKKQWLHRGRRDKKMTWIHKPEPLLPDAGNAPRHAL